MCNSIPVLGGASADLCQNSYQGFMATTQCILDSTHTPVSAQSTMNAIRY